MLDTNYFSKLRAFLANTGDMSNHASQKTAENVAPTPTPNKAIPLATSEPDTVEVDATALSGQPSASVDQDPSRPSRRPMPVVDQDPSTPIRRGSPPVDVNEAPVVNDQAFSMAENSANGTVVGSIVTHDPDVDDTRTFAVTGGTGQPAFAVDATTGEITVADSSLLNFAATQNLTLDVQVTDASGLSDTAVITVNVTN